MRTALITGASDGIGLELARVFARDGWDLVIVARNADKLEAVATELRGGGSTVRAFPCDLSRDGVAEDLFARVEQAGSQIEAMVNNAGISNHGEFKDTPLDVELGEIHLNVIALTALTKLFVRPMVSRGHGYVLNVASTAAFQPGPLMAVYYASKAYVLALTEALADELRGSGIRVTALCPGPTETGFAERGKMPRTRLYLRGGMAPSKVAHAGYRAMLAGKTVFIPGFWNRVAAFSPRISPRALVVKVVRHLNESVD